MIDIPSCTLIVLALLVNFPSASTIPLNGHGLYPSLNTTLSSPSFPSGLGFPPEPFRYRIVPYRDSETSIIFTNYGPAVSYDDAARTLLEAQVIIMREMARDPQQGDLPVGRTRVFSYGSVKVTIQPQPELNHVYLGLWLAGATEAGNQYGFVECDMRFLDQRPIFGTAGFTLGTATLRLT